MFKCKEQAIAIKNKEETETFYKKSLKKILSFRADELFELGNYFKNRRRSSKSC